MMFQRQSLVILLTGLTASVVGAFVTNGNTNAFVSPSCNKRKQQSISGGSQVVLSAMEDYLSTLSAPVVAAVAAAPADTKASGAAGKGKKKGKEFTAYCVNLAYETTNKDLRAAFGEFGKVESVYIPIDQKTERPKGIAFVSMSTEEELQAIIDKFADTQLGGRRIFVTKAKPRGEVGTPKEESTKMYIGNISFETTSEELTEYFSTWGRVKDCYLPTDRQTGQPRGFAFITMTPEGVAASIENADGIDFGGRTIEVKVSLPRGTKAPKRQKSPETKLYIGNLSYDTDEEVLREVFEQYGTLLDVYMPIDRYSGERRGFAFISVHPDVAAQIVEELDGFELDGRILRVNEAKPKGTVVERYVEDEGEYAEGDYAEGEYAEGEYEGEAAEVEGGAEE